MSYRLLFAKKKNHEVPLYIIDLHQSNYKKCNVLPFLNFAFTALILILHLLHSFSLFSNCVLHFSTFKRHEGQRIMPGIKRLREIRIVNNFTVHLLLTNFEEGLKF